MTQRRQISVHLEMALLIPLKSDLFFDVVINFHPKTEEFLELWEDMLNLYVEFLDRGLWLFFFLIFVVISSLEILFFLFYFCGNFLFGNFLLYLLGMFLILLNIGTFCNLS